MKTIGFSLIFLTIMSLASCSATGDIPKTVSKVDLQKYAGKWYEIARFPNSFQKNCFCSTAEYTLTDKGYVKVFNACRKGGLNGKVSSITGKAFPVVGSSNAKLRVQFFWPFRADYWIIGLADDYSWAAVSGPSRKYLWILSRSPQMDEAVYQHVLLMLRENGFDLSLLERTQQRCE
jgi:apolipoprotein D and lipocalin family protein